MAKHRRRFSAEQKAVILREYLIDHVSISDLCDKHGLAPTVFYRWQKEAFENLPALFERKTDSRQSVMERENKILREKLASKDAVISEIMEDMIALKKKTGDLS